MRIAVFGALEIKHEQEEPRRPPTVRVLALLGYLIAHHQTPQGRDKLVEVLWPDLPPRQGRRILSDTLWRARRLLTPSGALDTALLQIAGDALDKPYELNLEQLRTSFEQVELNALCQCSGNRRGLSDPHVPGVQWGYGAMGNARWKEVAGEVQTDANGTFSFLVHEGLSYVVSARYSEPSTPARTHSTGSSAFVGSEQNVKILKVVLLPVRR